MPEIFLNLFTARLGIFGGILQAMYFALLVAAIVEMVARSDTDVLMFVPAMLYSQAALLIVGAKLNFQTFFLYPRCFSGPLYVYSLYLLLLVTSGLSLLAWGIAVLGRCLDSRSRRRRQSVVSACFGGTITVLTGIILNLFVAITVLKFR